LDSAGSMTKKDTPPEPPAAPTFVSTREIRALSAKIEAAITAEPGIAPLTILDMRMAAFLLKDFALFIEFTEWKPKGRPS
jgi:hypothetical protein